MSMPSYSLQLNGKKLRQSDPYLAEEKQKYAHPLPSRLFIVSVLSTLPEPLTANQLHALFGIRTFEKVAFENRLNAMERAAQIRINKKGEVHLGKHQDSVKCRIQGHPDGYGFAIPEKAVCPDIFLTKQAMRRVFHGDEVLIRITGLDRKKRPQGRIVKVLTHAIDHLVGFIESEGGVLTVKPDNKYIQQAILLEQQDPLRAKRADVVRIKIVRQPTAHCPAVAKILEVLGNVHSLGIEKEIAIQKYALPHLFSPATIQESQKIPTQVLTSDLTQRIDLRGLPFVTIDGQDAKDFDDAVFAEKVADGWRLTVAISDVSYYVKAGSALDQAAFERGTSVYFTQAVIPMLPERLSNGICSLNPHVERLCVVCDIRITLLGLVKTYEFYPAVIHSKARLTYESVQEWITTQTFPEDLPIEALYSVFHLLLSERKKRGAIDFDTVEAKISFDEEGKIQNLQPAFRTDAHRLIEECMLLANTCAADFMVKHKHPTLYRVHEGPTREKLEALRKILAFFGLSLSGADQPKPSDYAVLSEKIKDRPNKEMLEIALLRSMQQAIYSPQNKGHFGLAYSHYVHFTSPIRRYPDLLVHRAIKAILSQQRLPLAQTLEKIGEHCSFTERRAEEASYDVEAWLKTAFMQDKVGQIFDGKISGVTSFGLFVRLHKIYLEGLVHIATLGEDYFSYHPETLSIQAERTGKVYRLGDPVRICVAAAKLESRQIDFVLVESLPSKERTKG